MACCVYLQGGYPARLKKVLIVTAPLWFKAPFKILRLFVREKLRERVFTVSVPTLSLHVPRKALPIHLGGTLEIEHNSWLLHCRKSMTNREDELLANIGGLSTAAATATANQNNIIGSQTANNQQQHITQTAAGVVANGDCQRYLAEPNENIERNPSSPLTNGHHTLVPITNTLNNTVVATANPTNNSININNTSPIHSNKLINLTNGVTTPNGDTVSALVNGVGGICATTTATSGAVSVGGGGGGGGGGVGVGGNCQTGLADFWTENPPSSASSGFSDDDSLAGQEGDPKTIEQIVQMVKTLGRQGLVKEYNDIRSRAPDGTFLHAK